MFEQDGSVMIFWHSVSQPQENKSFSYFARGICSTLNRFICVGTCTGSILVFDVPPQGTAVKLHETLDHHKVGITDLASVLDKMVSADEDGNITVWQCDETSRQIAEIRGSGTPCMSLALWNGFITAAYSSGHIRIFDLALGILKTEICAHSRCVNSLDIASETGLLLSVGEDSFVRVWVLPKDSANKVELLFQSPVSDSQLCGGRFLDESGQSFGVSGYDLAEIVVFGKK
ncbi:WD repeat-containing 54-like [Paramuricea clavata]|uniref:WD repeat-containing 54-like n=1 Tax=Paramuricea clavata TaxID=317549 RepID=A0A7D9EQG5_PARCT|nr:WD repeat-containing 54-like [Paramuricea clavata]